MAKRKVVEGSLAVEDGDCIVTPFGISIDHHRNADCVIQSIPGCVLRSRLAQRTVKDKDTGEELVPIDEAAGLGSIPKTPGMELHVNPEKCKYRIIDPLYEDEELAQRLTKRLLARYGRRKGKEWRGCPPQEGELDRDRTKTLVREMYHYVISGEARVCKGVLPTMEEIEQLPGEFLLNPGSQVPNLQPRYEKDYEAYKAKLSQAGG